MPGLDPGIQINGRLLALSAFLIGFWLVLRTAIQFFVTSIWSILMQPHPMTSVMQLAITAASLCIAAAAVTFAVKSMSEERNARLVEIGVGILRVDPEKEAQVSAARKWALDLIDANAGGVKFSQEARTELLRRRLDYSEPIGSYNSTYIPPYYNTYTPPSDQVPPTPSK